jgi:hypothetical protein
MRLMAATIVFSWPGVFHSMTRNAPVAADAVLLTGRWTFNTSVSAAIELCFRASIVKPETTQRFPGSKAVPLVSEYCRHRIKAVPALFQRGRAVATGILSPLPALLEARIDERFLSSQLRTCAYCQHDVLCRSLGYCDLNGFETRFSSEEF